MKAKKMRTTTETLHLEVEGKPVTVKVTPYHMHTMEKRYRVSVNNSPVHIFAWDDNAGKLVAIDGARIEGKLPVKLEEAISRQLHSRMAA